MENLSTNHKKIQDYQVKFHQTRYILQGILLLDIVGTQSQCHLDDIYSNSRRALSTHISFEIDIEIDM